jgi:hypothetical protein
LNGRASVGSICYRVHKRWFWCEGLNEEPSIENKDNNERTNDASSAHKALYIVWNGKMKNKIVQIFVMLLLSSPIIAQVPARDEPRHKVALYNDYIRLLDVRIQPGDTSLFHVHQVPSFFIPLSTTMIGSEVKGQPARQSTFPIDSTWYNGFENGPLIHRVWNNDTNTLHVIDLELLATKNSPLPNTIQLPFKIDFENEKLRVYKFELQPGQVVALPLIKNPMLLVSIFGADVRLNDLDQKKFIDIKPGNYRWLDPNQHVDISKRAGASTRAILILFK